MGNTNSTTAAKNLTNEIDRIATYYIFSMTDDVLSKMSEKDYCNKLVILTAKVFDEKLNNLEYVRQIIEENRRNRKKRNRKRRNLKRRKIRKRRNRKRRKIRKRIKIQKKIRKKTKTRIN